MQNSNVALDSKWSFNFTLTAASKYRTTGNFIPLNRLKNVLSNKVWLIFVT